ncbi:electron transport complex subunit RsxC, partial [Actinobacillus succinogenes]|uniref:electron transport complex subunit RsxC n=2 Tax=Pasteurellaceae TaxID=712 RepID=UPI00359C5E9F
MNDVLARFNSGKLWTFDGGIHPPEMKSQSNQTPITRAPLAETYYVPVKQHAGSAGNILVKPGDKVLKGQPLTLGEGLRALPVHAPTSGTVTAIAPHVAAHPSGLSELCIEIQADGLDQWRERRPLEDFLSRTPEQLIETIYHAGIAGLGGAAFPTAAKIHSAEKQVKLLIINGAECEPYITCDDRLMRDYPAEIIEGIRILRYILRPENVVLAIEDNKPQAVAALTRALHGANDIEIRVIPTKYPSGASKQLIQVLTGLEVPSGQRSSRIGVLMHNVGTAFAVKRAIMDDEPQIERVVTLTGDKIPHKGNQWVRFGTPIAHLLQQAGYHYDDRFPVFMGGPMMGVILPDLNAPVTKVTNCLLAPDHFEYAPPEPEQSCIRCSACSDACPVHLMPQQLYWFARSEDHEKSEQYALKDCIECGVCAYVCPSHIPLIQYFRQEKAKLWEIKDKAHKAEEAKVRFEARQARLQKEEQARKARAQRAAENRRAELAQQQGVDPVQAALERLKAKQSAAQNAAQAQIKTVVNAKGEVVPDNSEIMAQRKARRLARQQAEQQTPSRAQPTTDGTAEKSAVEKTTENSTALDNKKAALAAAIARAKAKKAAQNDNAANLADATPPAETVPPQSRTQPATDDAAGKSAVEKRTEHNSAVEKTGENSTALDDKKAAIAAAIARAKAKKAAQQNDNTANRADMTPPAETVPPQSTVQPVTDGAAGKSAVEKRTEHNSAIEKTRENSTALDDKKAAIAAAIARAKAKKAAQNDNAANHADATPPAETVPPQSRTQPATDGAAGKSAVEKRTEHNSAIEKTRENS